MIENIHILGIKITRLNLSKILDEISILLIKGEKFYVCAPNAYLTVISNEDKELSKILNNAKIVIPDGMPLIWYSKTFKKSLTERISGFDFFYNFSKFASSKGYSYFFMGGENEVVLEKIKKRLEGEFKNIKIKGYYSPPLMDSFNHEINNEIISIINKCEPDILWVGLSAPKQEKWISKNIDKLNIKMACGIGAVFNFYSGVIKRSPKWMQRMGLEWLYRLFAEPRRLFKKYLIYNTKFLNLVLRDALRRIFSGNNSK